MRPSLAVIALAASLAARCDDRRPSRGADAGVAASAKPSAAASAAPPGPAPPKFARARAYFFNREKTVCESILDERGALCVSAEKPGVALSEEQIRYALAAFATPHPGVDMAAWCFDPHHGIVLYDDADKPVGAMSICFECGRKGRWPALPGRERDYPPLDRASHEVFRAIFCDELELGPCAPYR